MKKANLIIGSFLLILILSCNNDENKSEKKKEPTQDVKSLVELDTSKINPDNINTYTAGTLNATLKQAVPGVATSAPGYISIVAAPIDGIVTKLHKNEGERVRKGEVILEIESIEYGNLVSDFVKAISDLEFQTKKLNRKKKLTEKGVSSESELEEAEAEKARSEANLKAVKARLMAIGMTENSISNLKNKDNAEPHLLIKSKINGVINNNDAQLGMPVNAYDKLATILNPEKILVKAYLSPEYLNYVSKGDSVSISRKTSPDIKSIKSVISSLNPGLSENNQSVIANIFVNTVDGFPVTGENIRVELSSSLPGNIIAVPNSAIVYLGEKAVVFVKKDRTSYKAKQIMIKQSDDKNSFVNGGIKEGDEIAVSNVFTLKSMLRFNQFSE